MSFYKDRVYPQLVARLGDPPPIRSAADSSSRKPGGTSWRSGSVRGYLREDCPALYGRSTRLNRALLYTS